MNTEFAYIYRDGDNYKAEGSVVLVGEFEPGHLARLEVALDEGEYFIAHQVGVPEVFIWKREGHEIQDQDHSWHEFFGICLVNASSTDTRSVEQFVLDVEQASVEGWEEFDVNVAGPTRSEILGTGEE